jgi:hypothetical protein
MSEHDTFVDMPWGGVLDELATEREKQDARWGEQNHPIRWPAHDEIDRQLYAAQAGAWKRINAERVRLANEAGATPDRNCSWDGIALEELYEALAEGEPAKIRAELVQAGAVIVAMIESLDRNGDRS